MNTMKTIGAVGIIALTGALYAQNTNCKCGNGQRQRNVAYHRNEHTSRDVRRVLALR